jgi:hypothetical protein
MYGPVRRDSKDGERSYGTGNNQRFRDDLGRLTAGRRIAVAVPDVTGIVIAQKMWMKDKGSVTAFVVSLLAKISL